MNTENIDKLIAHLRMVPKSSFSMYTFREGNISPSKKEIQGLQEGHTCGTVACIAGHADLLVALEKNWDRAKYARSPLFGEVTSPKERAQQWLGLTNEQTRQLFLSWDWPDPSIHDAIVTLEYLKETGEVSWTRARNWARDRAEALAAQKKT